MSDELLVVGKRFPRWNVFEKVTGTAKYTADIDLPGMLAGKVLTSPYPHAHIVKIDKFKAEKLPGVETVITFEDIPQKLFTPSKHHLTLYNPEYEIKDMYVLTNKSRFVGDRIAAVAAVDKETAEKALDLIKVEYQILPSVFDPIEAMQPEAPVIHDFAKNNISCHIHFPGGRGNVEKGFQEADILVEDTFQTSKQHTSQLEPCACIANFSPDGRLTIWSPGQSAFVQKTNLAELFDIPAGMIRWITPHVGGAFGKYGAFGVEPICVALAMKTMKPVKIEYSREEDFFGTETRQTYITIGKIGVKKNGTITALQERLITQSGAYSSRNASTSMVNMSSFTGLYKCPNTAAQADCVYTNVPMSGGVRGFGNSEGTCILEQLIDKAARKLGMDPIQLRLKNLKKAGDPSNTGLIMETCTFDELIRMGAAKFGWEEKRKRKKEKGSKKRGVGMAIMMDVSGGQPFSIQHRNAFIKFNEDGSANLMVSSCDMGQNIIGTMAQIAAEVLGLRYEDIHVVTGDTDSTMFDTGQQASASCYQIGNAVMKAANQAKMQLQELGARHLGVEVGKIEIKDRRIYDKSDKQKWVSVAEIAKKAIYNFEDAHSNITGIGSFSPTENPPPFAAVFAEVAVDIETGETQVLKIMYLHDPGKAINPATAEGQVEGAISQSIGYSLTEDYFINKKTGVLESDNFTTYKIPSVLDMPETEVILLEAPVPSGPFGAKGIGQGATVAVNPAIANAIYDAVDVFIKEMPATPEKILKILKEKGQDG